MYGQRIFSSGNGVGIRRPTSQRVALILIHEKFLDSAGYCRFDWAARHPTPMYPQYLMPTPPPSLRFLLTFRLRVTTSSRILRRMPFGAAQTSMRQTLSRLSKSPPSTKRRGQHTIMSCFLQPISCPASMQKRKRPTVRFAVILSGTSASLPRTPPKPDLSESKFMNPSTSTPLARLLTLKCMAT